jgi:predicted ester cyclase
MGDDVRYCPGKSPTTRSIAMAQDIRELARRWFEDNWNRRRAEIVDELLAENAVGHMEGTDVHGREEFRAVRATLLGAFPDLALEVEDTIAEGDKVAVRWSVRSDPSRRTFRFPGKRQARALSRHHLVALRRRHDRRRLGCL